MAWPNSWMDQDATSYGSRPRSRRRCVRWGPNSPHQTGHSPQFLAHVCCSQTAGWMRMPLGTEVGLGPGDIVLDGDPAHSHLTHILSYCMVMVPQPVNPVEFHLQ